MEGEITLQTMRFESEVNIIGIASFASNTSLTAFTGSSTIFGLAATVTLQLRYGGGSHSEGCGVDNVLSLMRTALGRLSLHEEMPIGSPTTPLLPCWLLWTLDVEEPSLLQPAVVAGVLNATSKASRLPAKLGGVFERVLSGVVVERLGLHVATAVASVMQPERAHTLPALDCSVPPRESGVQLLLRLPPRSCAEGACEPSREHLRRTIEAPLIALTSGGLAAAADTVRQCIAQMVWPHLLMMLQPLTMPADLPLVPNVLTLIPPVTASRGLPRAEGPYAEAKRADDAPHVADLYPQERPLVPLLGAGVCLPLMSGEPVCFDVNATFSLPIGIAFQLFGLPGADWQSASALMASHQMRRLKDAALDALAELLMPRLPDGQLPHPPNFVPTLTAMQMQKMRCPLHILSFAHSLLQQGRDTLREISAGVVDGTATSDILDRLSRSLRDYVQVVYTSRHRRNEFSSMQQAHSRVFKVGLHLTMECEGGLCSLLRSSSDGAGGASSNQTATGRSTDHGASTFGGGASLGFEIGLAIDTYGQLSDPGCWDWAFYVSLDSSLLTLQEMKRNGVGDAWQAGEAADGPLPHEHAGCDPCNVTVKHFGMRLNVHLAKELPTPSRRFTTSASYWLQTPAAPKATFGLELSVPWSCLLSHMFSMVWDDPSQLHTSQDAIAVLRAAFSSFTVGVELASTPASSMEMQGATGWDAEVFGLKHNAICFIFASGWHPQRTQLHLPPRPRDCYGLDYDSRDWVEVNGAGLAVNVDYSDEQRELRSWEPLLSEFLWQSGVYAGCAHCPLPSAPHMRLASSSAPLRVVSCQVPSLQTCSCRPLLLSNAATSSVSMGATLRRPRQTGPPGGQWQPSRISTSKPHPFLCDVQRKRMAPRP